MLPLLADFRCDIVALQQGAVMLLAAILYGSRARGDHRATSDTDILGIIENGPIRTEVSNGGVSLYHYPLHLLRAKAYSGDLFVLHLVKEGRVLHDTADAFKNLKSDFAFRESYSEDILVSSIIIKFFSSREKLLAQKAARKRLVWALRTILIARSAERKRPVFSSKELAAFSGIANLKSIIDERHRPGGDELMKAASRVLTQFGASEADFIWPDDKAGQRALLVTTGGIAADTLRFIGGRWLHKSVVARATSTEGLPIVYPD